MRSGGAKFAFDGGGGNGYNLDPGIERRSGAPTEGHWNGAEDMAQFDERETNFEKKYKHDKELEFKINARRNKLLGLWVGELLGLKGPEADAYAKSVVMADFERPGDQDVVDKVLADCRAKGVEMSEHRVRKHMADLIPAARVQILSDVKE